MQMLGNPNIKRQVPLQQVQKLKDPIPTTLVGLNLNEIKRYDPMRPVRPRNVATNQKKITWPDLMALEEQKEDKKRGREASSNEEEVRKQKRIDEAEPTLGED